MTNIMPSNYTLWPTCMLFVGHVACSRFANYMKIDLKKKRITNGISGDIEAPKICHFQCSLKRYAKFISTSSSFSSFWTRFLHRLNLKRARAFLYKGFPYFRKKTLTRNTLKHFPKRLVKYNLQSKRSEDLIVFFQ